MASATVRSLRNHFPALLKRLENGEEIEITRRGKLVGKLVPTETAGQSKVCWPNLVERLKVQYGTRQLGPVASILKQRETER